MFQRCTGPFADTDPVLTVFSIRPSFLRYTPIGFVEKKLFDWKKTSSIFSCPSFDEWSIGSWHWQNLYQSGSTDFCCGLPHWHWDSNIKLKTIRINYFARPFDGSFFACFFFFCLYRGRAWYESLACLFHFAHRYLHSYVESDEYLFYQSFFCPR